MSTSSPATLLFIAQIATNEVLEYKPLKNNRMFAAIKEKALYQLRLMYLRRLSVQYQLRAEQQGRRHQDQALNR